GRGCRSAHCRGVRHMMLQRPIAERWIINTFAKAERAQRIIDKIVSRCVYVDRGYEGGPCLEWQGPTSGSAGRGKAGRGHSYPRFCLDGQTVAVHRALWVCLHGYLPGKKQLDHLCKNRVCVLHCEP